MVDALQNSTQSSRAVDADTPVHLPLVSGPAALQPRHTLLSSLHFFLTTLFILLRLPFHLLYHFVFFRRTSSLLKHAPDRTPWLESMAQLAHLYFHAGYLKPSRWFFQPRRPDKWLSKRFVTGGGVRAQWVAVPGEKDRKEDDLVVVWIHGGAFVHHTVPADLCVSIVKSLHEDHGVKVSVLLVDYRLAPEFIYPSQTIESLAAYHWLVNDVGIPESKICLAGDSAGGNIVLSMLLHLARRNPRFRLQERLGETPKRPASVYLMSPFVSIISSHPSRTPCVNLDIIENGGLFQQTLGWLGVVPPYDAVLSGWNEYAPSWNPIHWLTDHPAADAPPPGLVEDISIEEAETKGGLKLLSSPYVNPTPAVVKDLEWYAEALPGGGKTMVNWGGAEIFADDITEFVAALERAGVAPATLYKALGVHEWPVFDATLPASYLSKKGAEEDKWDYGLKQTVKFLAEQAGEGKKTK